MSLVPAHARHQRRREEQNSEGKENLARTLTYTLLNAQHALLVVLRDEAHRDTAAARTRGTADAVRVLLGLGGDVPVDDERDVLDVQPARADVRRHEHGHDRRATRGRVVSSSNVAPRVRRPPFVIAARGNRASKQSRGANTRQIAYRTI